MANDDGSGIDRRALLAGSAAAGASVVLTDDVRFAHAREEAHLDSSVNEGRISVGPKKTIGELKALTERIQPEPRLPGQPPQEFDGQTNERRWAYHHHLEPSWDNARWAANHDHTQPDSPYYRDPYFDRDGYRQNEELKKAITEVFIKHKKIDVTDPAGPQWLLAWRMYPNKDHPRWGKEGFEGCGCNCGCYCPGTWP
jgi:hypothetical protein